MTESKLETKNLRLFYEPKDRLRLTVEGDKSYLAVRPAWAAPLSHPNRFLSLLNSKGEEIAMVEEPSDLDEHSLAAVTTELERRYLTSTIRSIVEARSDFGATYWRVQTKRGERDFVTQSLQENAQWLGERHLLLIDVDGNRFEIPDIGELDASSQKFIESAL
jgi:hypothetical protein